MDWFKNLPFVRKIQGGFFMIAAVSTLVVILGYYQLYQLGEINDSVFNDYVAPREEIMNIYASFQKTQFIMMQMAMEEFSEKFRENAGEYNEYKIKIDASLDSLLTSNLDEETKEELNQIKEIWKQYKNNVADAILSASVTGDYEMAGVIATTSGEDIGKTLQSKFAIINASLVSKADELKTTVADMVANALLLTILSALIGTIIWAISTFYLAPAVTKPINKLKNVVREFSIGNYDIDIRCESKDEVGELADMFVGLREAQIDKIHAAQEIASGNMKKVKIASDKDALSIAFNEEIDTINDMLNEANMLIRANKEGNLGVRGNVSKFSGAWGELIGGVNSILDSVVAPLNESSQILSAMANGDLTKKISGDYQGNYKAIKDNINMVIDSLSSTLVEVARSASAVATSSSDISSSSEEMAAGSSEQTQQAAEVAAAVEEMTATILENTKNASYAANTAIEAGNKAKEGGSVVKETIAGMLRITDVVNKSADTVEILGKSSDQIGEIVQVIDDIADQTNLLALNAAIEAARAGEQGRGFAVVADEVRKLAERTTKATKEIAQMIKKIQKDTAEAVGAMHEGKEEVEKGKELAMKADVVLNDIIIGAEKVSDIATQVAAASEEQSKTAEQISRNIEAISSVTEQSAAGIQEIARSAEDLNQLTLSLQQIMNRFSFDSEFSSQNSDSTFGGRLLGNKT
ncbi:MAG: MCP four helix bundle domain-containing protein [Ignavibacteriaceae bacterium]|nr:MCP four helix bundle domain-containing protein [Ignavibacteriaceae bacterium]